MLELYAREWIISVEDISEFVREQRKVRSWGFPKCSTFSRQYQNIGDYNKLIVPSEIIYPVTDAKVAAQLQISGDAILLPNGNTNEL